jgi:nucleotide-binding universal stress UspA family protein
MGRSMSHRIVLPVDGSPYSRWAGEFVARHLAGADLRVTLLHVLRPVPAIEAAAADPAAVERFHESEAQRMLAPFQRMLERRGVRHDARSRVGSPGAGIAAQVAEDGAELVVMGARGVGALHELAFGSTLQRLASATSVPVLALRKPPARRKIRRALLAVDGSAPSQRAVHTLVAFGELLGVDLKVDLVHVARAISLRESLAFGLGSRPQYYAGESERAMKAPRRVLEAAGLTVEPLAGVGDAAATIAATATERGDDLVVIGTHGRGGAGRLALGSVSRSVLARCEVPVLLVR